jgi:hypothetical protein
MVLPQRLGSHAKAAVQPNVAVPVGSKYSADHEVQWRTSVRSTDANDSPSNRALNPVRPAAMSKSAPPVGSKYSADHEVQWWMSVRSRVANDSPSNRALDPVQPAEMPKSTPPQVPSTTSSSAVFLTLRSQDSLFVIRLQWGRGLSTAETLKRSESGDEITV